MDSNTGSFGTSSVLSLEAGDNRVWARIMDRVQPELRRYFRHSCRCDASTAEDLTAEVIQVLHDQRARGAEGLPYSLRRKAFRGWIRGIATNLVLQYRRRSVTAESKVEWTEELDSDQAPAALDELVQASDSVLIWEIVRRVVSEAQDEYEGWEVKAWAALTDSPSLDAWTSRYAHLSYAGLAEALQGEAEELLTPKRVQRSVEKLRRFIRLRLSAELAKEDGVLPSGVSPR